MSQPWRRKKGNKEKRKGNINVRNFNSLIAVARDRLIIFLSVEDILFIENYPHYEVNCFIQNIYYKYITEIRTTLFTN